VIRTKIITDIEEVPHAWVYEYYCNLPITLAGQSIKIKSLWNKENTPSMYIAMSNGIYFFKDFSSGKGGNHINLVAELFNESNHAAVIRILKDYNNYIKDKGKFKVIEFKPEEKYKLDEFKLRLWNKLDEKYWTQFGIGSYLLEQYNVKPIAEAVLKKPEYPDIKIASANCYGYFKNDGSLYRIYQPYSTNKFTIINGDYIQGLDQLSFQNEYIIICSSLKDIMSFKATKIKADAIAPNSENTLLKESTIKWLKNRYKHVIVLFDNDKPGKEAANRYQIYNIYSITLNLSKDISDSIMNYGIDEVRLELLTELRKYKNENFSS
jgi:DNA primase